MTKVEELAERLVETVRNGGTIDEIKQEFMRSAEQLVVDPLARYIALLMEQEPVEPGKVQMGNRTDWYCRNCTTTVGRLFSEEDAWRFHHNFCPYCGKKVKWK